MKRQDVSAASPLLALLALLMLSGGCATESATEKSFGNSVRHMVAQQIHQPGDDAAGLEGEKSRNVLEEHRKDVAKPKTVEKVINIKLD